MPKVIVSDASCLIVLNNINLLDLLCQLYGNISTTAAIAAEYGDPLPEWIDIRNPIDVKYQQILETMLDQGEASAIALCLEINDVLLIIDEKKGRNVATSLGIQITGSLGIILRAKQKLLIDRISPILDLMGKQGFRIDPKLKEEVLRLAGELN